MKKDYFGEEVAARYDDGGPMFGAEVVDPTVDFLAELAGDGRRSSSASARAGSRRRSRGAACRVHGIDLSEAMVARLRGEARRGARSA